MASRPVRLTRRLARQIAVAGQLLDRRRPPGLIEAVEGLLLVQLDPTALLARTELLVLRNRQLRGDDLVARLDARADRAASVLRSQPCTWSPRPATPACNELDRLAAWLGLGEVAVERVVR